MAKHQYSEFSLAKLIAIPRKQEVQGHQLKIDLTHTQYEVVRAVATQLGWRLWNKLEDKKQEAVLLWRDTYTSEDFLRKLLPYQRVNRFPCSYQLGRKSNLALNLNRIRKVHSAEYNFYPRTWCVPSNIEQFRKYATEHSSTFILKPEAMCQGRGIVLLSNPIQLYTQEPMVIQEYIANPLLIDGLKFDFRLYVLLQSLNPLRIYLYREGLARFATRSYSVPSPGNLEDHRMHLTNYAINKKSPDFVFNSKVSEDHVGHKRSLSSILALLALQQIDVEKLMAKIQMIINKTVAAAFPQLSKQYEATSGGKDGLSFQIFGFDILIDDSHEPWLLEVNHTPSFTTDTPLDLEIKKNLIFDTFRLMNFSDQAKRSYLDQKAGRKNKFRWNEGDLGGFVKIFPGNNSHRLIPLINGAILQWQKATGIKRPHSQSLVKSHNAIKTKLKLQRIGKSRLRDESFSTALSKREQLIQETVPIMRSFEQAMLQNRCIFSVFMANHIGADDMFKGREQIDQLLKLRKLQKNEKNQDPKSERQEIDLRSKPVVARQLRDIRFLKHGRQFLRGDLNFYRNENPLEITGEIISIVKVAPRMKHLVKR